MFDITSLKASQAPYHFDFISKLRDNLRVFKELFDKFHVREGIVANAN